MSNPYDLTWTARLDQRHAGPEGGKHHVLVDVTAPRAPRDEEKRRPPLNLALVIDASGSMAGGALEAAKTAARGVIETLDTGDRLTLVSFADDVIVHADARPLGADGRAAALAAVDGLHTRGCTNLAAGWLEGCDRVAIEMERNGDDGREGAQNRVILLSDGHANRGLTDPEELALRAAGLRQRGLYTSTVGIGDGYSPTQLEVLAEHGGGRLHDAPLGEDIVAVVLGELGEILQAAADDLTLTVTHPRTVSVVAFGRLPVETGDGRLKVSLGGITAGATRQVVLQVAVPAGAAGDWFEVTLAPTWRTPEGEERQAAPLDAGVARVSRQEIVAVPRNLDIRRRVAELWFNHIMLESTLLNSEGRFEDAERMVREAIADFRRYCDGVPGTSRFVRRLDDQGVRVEAPMACAMRLAYVDSSKRVLKQSLDFKLNRRNDSW